MVVVDTFKKSGLKVRDSQLKMIEIVANSVLKDKHAVISAGTGVGKTFGYLVGAWLGLKKLKSKDKLSIIVSTNTVALQEQLISKDLPFLEKLIGEKVSFMLAKGRGRYLCLRRFFNIEGESKVDNEEIQYLQNKLNLGWDGDVDNLSKSPDSKTWAEINNSTNTCTNKKCEFYNSCPFFTARRSLRKTDIVVVNHSLLMSHISLGDGAILPEFEKSIFIIDECQHFGKKALDSFSGQATVLASQDWVNDIDKAIQDLHGSILSPEERRNITIAKKNIVEGLRDAQLCLEKIYSLSDTTKESIVRLKEIPPELVEISKKIKYGSQEYIDVLYKAKKGLDKFVEESTIHSKESLEKKYTAIGFFSERSRNLNHVWTLMLMKEDPPIAKWFMPKDRNQESKTDLVDALQDFMVCASHIEASALLKKLFWDQVEHSVILCSATVKSMGNFKRFIDSTGIDSDVDTFDLPSPFPYSKSQIIIPNFKSIPTNSDMHILESARYVEEELSSLKHGAMVLFTSMYAMRKLFDILPNRLQLRIIMQGEKSKRVIMNSHKAMIDRGSASIIFGVDSFAEGVDFPGKYLETLIIHKLPFSVPTDPIEKTRSEWLESNGRKPFFEVSLPDASIKLTQMVGRLIRDEEDQGKVIILDTRLVTKRYGQQMLWNLPKFQISNYFKS